MAYRSFEELDVWKRATRLSVDIMNGLKDCYDFVFKSQIARSAISVPSNIAEGAERQTGKEFKYFLNVAKGSAAELRTQLYIALETNFLSKDQCKKFITETRELSAMMQGLINSLETKLNT